MDAAVVDVRARRVEHVRVRVLGQEVGIRTNLDVLLVQQNVFTARRDVANAYFQYLIAVLRLKASVGALTEQDVEEMNRRLRG